MPVENNQTRVEAEQCARSLPVGMFGIDDVLIAIQVIEFGFRLFQACKAPSDSSEAVAYATVCQMDGVEFRRARRRVRRSAVRKGLDLATSNLNGLTAHMLNHVTKADRVSLSACCQEPLIQDVDSDD